MALYITLAELAERPGAEELAQVATPQRYHPVAPELLDALLRGGEVGGWEPADLEVGAHALDVIVDAVNQAQGLIDGFLARRGYSLPLASVPPVVAGWARAITRYTLHKDRLSSEGTDPIVRDYKDAMRLLQLLAEGKFSIGAADPLTPAGGGAPEYLAPPRVFSLDTLRDY